MTWKIKLHTAESNLVNHRPSNWAGNRNALTGRTPTRRWLPQIQPPDLLHLYDQHPLLLDWLYSFGLECCSVQNPLRSTDVKRALHWPKHITAFPRPNVQLLHNYLWHPKHLDLLVPRVQPEALWVDKKFPAVGLSSFSSRLGRAGSVTNNGTKYIVNTNSLPNSRTTCEPSLVDADGTVSNC